MGKRSFLGCIVVCVIICAALLGVGLKTKSERQQTYNQALTYYEEGSYDSAIRSLEKLPDGYQDRDSLLEQLYEYEEIYAEYEEIYADALELIDDREYTDGVEKLKELPEGYEDRDLIIDNIDKIEILVENTWYDYFGSGWYYEATFFVSSYKDELTLYMSEDEYSGTALLNEYIDRIDLISLLEYGEVDVEARDRDDFTLDINNIENGTFTMKNYFTSEYHIKEE